MNLICETLVYAKKITIFANVNENGSAHRDSDTRVREKKSVHISGKWLSESMIIADFLGAKE